MRGNAFLIEKTHAAISWRLSLCMGKGTASNTNRDIPFTGVFFLILLER